MYDHISRIYRKQCFYFIEPTRLSHAEQRVVKRTDPYDWKHISMQHVFHSSLILHTFDCVSGMLQHLTWTTTAGYSSTFTSHTLIFKKSIFRRFTLPSLPPTSFFFQDLKLSTLVFPSIALFLCSSSSPTSLTSDLHHPG